MDVARQFSPHRDTRVDGADRCWWTEVVRQRERVNEPVGGVTRGDDSEIEVEAVALVVVGLVDDGTLTEAQRDAVVETLQNARPERGESRERLGERIPRGGAGAIAEILGLEGNEMREALRNGSSIAELAEAQGVDTADIVDAIVAQNEERLAAAVENGRIDDAQAAEMLTQAAERAEDLVNGDIEFEGRRGHRRGFGAPGGDAAVDTEASA